MPGLVMIDLMGGDYTFVVVSDMRWFQIAALDPTEMPGDDDQERNAAWREAVMWLTEENPEADRPAHVPAPAGEVIKTYYTQDGVLEPAGIQGPIRGILPVRAV